MYTDFPGRIIKQWKHPKWWFRKRYYISVEDEITGNKLFVIFKINKKEEGVLLTNIITEEKLLQKKKPIYYKILEIALPFLKVEGILKEEERKNVQNK